MSSPLPSPELRHDLQGALDDLVIDGAFWRVYRELAGHWLHTLRGSLNAMSLSLSLVELQTSGTAEAADRPARTLRRQLEELSAGLTRLLDHANTDDAPPNRCDAVAIADGVCRLVEPLAGHLHVRIERPATTGLVRVDIDPATLQALLVCALVDAVKRSEAGSTVSLCVETPQRDVASIEVRVEAGAAPASFTPGFLEASARALRRRGGDLRPVSSESPAHVIVLRQSSA